MRAQALSTVRVSDRDAGGPKIPTVLHDQTSTRGSAGAPIQQDGAPIMQTSTPRLLGSIIGVSKYWIPAFAGMTTEYEAAISRHELPEVCISLLPSPIRGRREGRVRAAPAVSCAIMRIARGAHEHTGSAGASRPSLRNGFTAYFALFPENGSFASVAPGTLSLPLDLTPAPRRQNHTTSPYASAALVSRSIGVHRIPPRIRDDRERPSSCGDDGRSYALDLA